MSNMYEEMKIAVLEGDEELAVELAEKALEGKEDLVQVMNEGFLKGIQEAGELYSEGEYFLPDLVCSAEAMKSALAIINPELKKSPDGIVSSGKAVIATVQGDIHDIGKVIVGAMLTAAGYEVTDLGADVPNIDVIEAVKEIKPDVLGLSALLTTTMEEQRNIIIMLEKENLRDEVRVIVGGAPVTQKWADKINADGYSEDAISAVELVKSLLA